MSVSAQPDQGILQRLVQPLTFEDFGSDIGSFRLAQAVAASAAYPVALAPVRLNIYPDHVPRELLGRADEALLESKYLYVADGGVYENEGMDPLISLIRTLPANQPIFLIAIDASQRMETVRVTGHKIWDPFSVVRKLYDIGTLRPLAYYGSILSQYHNPRAFDGVMIRMEGYEEKTDRFLQASQQCSSFLPRTDALWIRRRLKTLSACGELRRSYLRLVNRKGRR